jgi:hypothetical protein
MFLLILLSVFAIYSLLSLIPTLLTYGKPLKDSIVVEYAQNNEFVLNDASNDIVMNKELYRSFNRNFKGGAFYPINFTIFFKYYIDGMGMVWRWSKGAKSLDEVRFFLEA